MSGNDQLLASSPVLDKIDDVSDGATNEEEEIILVDGPVVPVDTDDELLSIIIKNNILYF